MKRFSVFLLVLILVVVSAVAYAYSGDLYNVPTFKFEHEPYGIGCGSCPVYSAPYQNAYRAANGKASVDTTAYIDVGGFNEQGWLLVRYGTNNGSSRVGWIPPQYVRNVRTTMHPNFTRIRQTANGYINVADNNLDPYDDSSRFYCLSPGETYYVLGRYNYYNYDFLYIEFSYGSQVARGFIQIW